jgi:hypothetical protein
VTEVELDQIIAELQAAVNVLAPPFLALPERGETAVTLAYRRGVRDAYIAVIAALQNKPAAPHFSLYSPDELG